MTQSRENEHHNTESNIDDRIRKVSENVVKVFSSLSSSETTNIKSEILINIYQIIREILNDINDLNTSKKAFDDEYKIIYLV